LIVALRSLSSRRASVGSRNSLFAPKGEERRTANASDSQTFVKGDRLRRNPDFGRATRARRIHSRKG
jgi:hypothetical protein